MDTSETYIKMRMAAQEDIPLRHFKGAASIFIVDNGVMLASDGYYYLYYDSTNEEAYGDLPTQDQLQEMVMNFEIYPPFLQLQRWHDWAFEYSLKYWYKFTSMEQLWLAFVMKEKHNKVWNSEEWIEKVSE